MDRADLILLSSAVERLERLARQLVEDRPLGDPDHRTACAAAQICYSVADDLRRRFPLDSQ